MAINRRAVLLGGAGLFAIGAAVSQMRLSGTARAAEGNFPFTLTDAEWRAKLEPLAYNVLRQEGTESPFSSPLNDEHRPGTFSCAGCEQALFDAATKFDSGTGWPSFYQPLPKAVGESTDTSLLMTRTEVHCSNCGGHLGHVFNDGPEPTGLRYCMNGVAMRFTPKAA